MDMPLFSPSEIARGSRPWIAPDLIQLWKVSALVSPGCGVKAWHGRFGFILHALSAWPSVRPFLRPEQNAFGRMIVKRPETVGAVVWPYINILWDARTRLERIRDHFTAIENAVPAFDFSIDEERTLFHLNDLLPGLRVVLDQPKWFMREGLLALNLFSDDTRLFSLAFSLRLEPDLVAYVGAVQGRNIDGVLDTYRQVTGALHGMRPRDFVIEAFRAFCRVAGVTKIYAVSDASRHHRSPYFGKTKEFTMNYDEVWQERGGTYDSPDFYSLPIHGTQRDLTEVPSKKRSMYRKRYDLLDRIESRIGEVLQR